MENNNYLNDIIEVYETQSYAETNMRLDLGWILINEYNCSTSQPNAVRLKLET